MNVAVDNHVQKFRQAEKLTQDELALELGITRQTVIAIEKGKYSPSLILAMKLAARFNRKVEEVFYFTT